MAAKLQSQGRSDTDGTGNKVTNHEAAFAAVLEQHGFTWIPKHKKDDHLASLPSEGLYYIYQVNGSQQAVDFQLMYVESHKIQQYVNIDCKYSSSATIMLNDGWFDKDIVYLVTWNPTKSTTKNFVGLVQHFTTEKDATLYAEVRKTIKQLNTSTEKGDCFKPYFRLASQYSVKAWDDSFIEKNHQEVLHWLQNASVVSLPTVASLEQQEPSKPKPKRAMKRLKREAISPIDMPLIVPGLEALHSQSELLAPSQSHTAESRLETPEPV
jgi:hypothetical protein